MYGITFRGVGVQISVHGEVHVGVNCDVNAGVRGDVNVGEHVGVNGDIDVGVHGDVNVGEHVGVNGDVNIGVHGGVQVGVNGDKMLHTMHSTINYTKLTIFSVVSKSRLVEPCMNLSKADK